MINKQEVFKLLNENPVFFLATVDGDQARVRGMLMFRADEEGIIFHTSHEKELYGQLKSNPKVELCFQAGEKQIRVTGEAVEVNDDALNQEILTHPSREFLRRWEENGVGNLMRVFRVKNGTAFDWTMDKNFSEKELVQL